MKVKKEKDVKNCSGKLGNVIQKAVRFVRPSYTKKTSITETIENCTQTIHQTTVIKKNDVAVFSNTTIMTKESLEPPRTIHIIEEETLDQSESQRLIMELRIKGRIDVTAEVHTKEDPHPPNEDPPGQPQSDEPMDTGE